jgi:hypothetical protein
MSIPKDTMEEASHEGDVGQESSKSRINA